MEVLNSPNLLFKWKDQTRILTKNRKVFTIEQGVKNTNYPYDIYPR
jgi:hypothetical protein